MKYDIKAELGNVNTTYVFQENSIYYMRFNDVYTEVLDNYLLSLTWFNEI